MFSAFLTKIFVINFFGRNYTFVGISKYIWTEHTVVQLPIHIYKTNFFSNNTAHNIQQEMPGRRKLFYTLIAPTLRQLQTLKTMAHLERRLFFFFIYFARI
jgi:hypothetical protein